MKDIDLAKKILMEEDYAIVVVRDGQVIYKDRAKGIRPIYELATRLKEEARGASLADRVIGRGAALLCGYLEIDELYSLLISKGGISILEGYGIPFSYEGVCDYIMNRDKTDYCPIEKISLKIEEAEQLLLEVGEFLKTI